MQSKKTIQHLIMAVLFTAFMGTFANAQMNYGFRAGLNFANFTSEAETDDAGNAVESWQSYTGFHLGVTLGYSFSDRFSVRSELGYNKRGSKYSFDGQMYRIFKTSTVAVPTFGTGLMQLVVTNTYLDIPLLAVGRFGDFEIFGGPYAGILFQTVADGSLRYEGFTQPQNQSTGEVRFNLQNNYRRDNIGEAVDASTTESVRLNGVAVAFPKVLGAYYDYPGDQNPEPLYKTLDYGLIGGVSYYVSSALYLSARVQYGLSDITRKESDLQRASLIDGQQVFRDDDDRNFAIQVSVGFNL